MPIVRIEHAKEDDPFYRSGLLLGRLKKRPPAKTQPDKERSDHEEPRGADKSSND